MNKQETLALFRKGREAWNAWARERIAERTKLSKGAASLTQWRNEATATFSDHAFYGDADFSSFIFPSVANFQATIFKHLAKFDRAKFHGYAIFERATFQGLASFRSSQFRERATFLALRAESSFDLAGVRFHKHVPNFVQAHFPEAPRFDHVRVPTVPELRRALVPVGSYATARYRALKRLAIQGHDHDREQQFFSDELRSQRGSFWNIRGLFIAAYGLFSDFGRSILRPLFSWIATTLAFAAVYYIIHTFKGVFSCANDGYPVSSAIYLALRKGLIFPALGRDQKLDQTFACLYGTTSLSEGGRIIPVIPDSIAYLGIAQTLISAVLIFLVLLAIRNQFRIK